MRTIKPTLGKRAIALSAAGLLSVGCAETQRTIRISSTPSGALVHLNDQEVGRTPLSVPFQFYGTYDVRLDKAGYQPRWTQADANAPWYEYPGPDLVAALIPGTTSTVSWHFDLQQATPAAQQDPDALLNHARQLRADLNRPRR